MPNASAPPGTAYCFDPLYLAHDLAGHPESRARLERVLAALDGEGLLERMTSIAPRPVDLELLARVHSEAHIAQVRQMAARGGGFLDADTYVSASSYDAALLAAGGLVQLVQAVLANRIHNGVALVRPPGHHATATQGMGFCLFNNVAVAAQAALESCPAYDIPARVLIVDWDVHHGNGTQDIFYDSPQVLYFSTHQYPHYPGTGHWRETGVGDGMGATVNLPLSAGVGDQGFARVFDEVLAPVTERFQPGLILVSAGYDAHWSDPLASLRLSLSGYWRMSKFIVALAERLCDGRLVVTLEGGYNMKVLARGVADTCRAMLGDDAPGADPLGPSTWPEANIDGLLRQVKQIHRVN